MEKIRVLYVDDEPSLLELGKLFLERDRELRVTTCESAPEAIQLLSTDTFDAIISDYLMPQMDGIAFLRHIREKGNKTPFIIFTGKGREDVVIDAINSGADFYIQKGGDPKPQFAELSNKVVYAVARRRSENALRESEERYRGVVEDQTEFICRFLPDGTILFVNDAYCRYFGLDRATIIGKRFVPVIHPDDKQKVARFFATRTPKDPSGTIDQRIIMPDGQVLWQTWNTRAIYNEEGKIREFQSVGRDITGQKLAMIALVRSEERYRMFAENITETITVLDLNLQVMYVSPSIRTLRGFTEEEALQQSLEDILTPSSLQTALLRFREEMEREAEGQGDPQKTISIDLEEYRKDNTTIWVNNTIRFIRDSDGRPSSLLIVSRDITEQKKVEIALIQKSDELFAANEELTATEEEIRHQFNELFKAKQEIESVQERLLLAMDAAEHGFWDWDLITNKAYFSPGYYTMLGYEPDEFPGNYQTWVALLHPDDAETIVPRIEEHIRKMEPYEEDFRLRCKDRSYRWISGRGKVYVSEQTGKPSRVLGVHVDINDRKQMEEELRKSRDLLLATQRLATTGGWEWSPDETLTWTEETYRIHEVNPDDIPPGSPDLIETSLSCFAPDDRETLKDAFRRCIREGEFFDMELPFTTIKGKHLWIRTVGKAVTEDKHTVRVIGFYSDITERKQAEIALQEERDLFSGGPVCTIIWGGRENWPVLSVSRNVHEILGYTPEELTDKNFRYT
ncbi:MAG: PAS domain S-box protein, partial [Methanospirillaceae archaeon]|nr:PAS domain S-box protein [Methanospirillaceae archaeon]